MIPAIFWTPEGMTLDTIREKRLLDISDGDTPNIRMNVRMLSIDTPEKRPTGRIRNADRLQEAFLATADWIETGTSPVPEALAAHLLPRLRRADAVARHLDQGRRATEAFEALKEEKLRRPTGSVRPLFVRVADERFDRYGRLLAYVAPSYTAEERAAMTRLERATFNLLMIESGWAAPFVLYPSIPGERDLPLLMRVAAEAVAEGRGAWGEADMLAGYEFRMCERLAAIQADVAAGRTLSPGDLGGYVYRYCADMTTGVLHTPADYLRVPPAARLFLWRETVREAVAALNLSPSEDLAAG